MYKCRTCGKSVAESVITCPHCGDVDAIYNNEIKILWDKYYETSKKHDNYIKTTASIVGIILMIFVFGLDTDNVWILLVKLGISWLIGAGIYWLGSYLDDKNREGDRIHIEKLEKCRCNLQLN
jgi:hypothetical protein